MLATTGLLPTGAGWAYEFKWDGVRAIAELGRRLRSALGAFRRGDHRRLSRSWPLGPPSAHAGDALLDGEVVVLRRERAAVVHRAGRADARPRARPAARLAASLPVTYMIFDLLRLDGADLTGRPYERAPRARWRRWRWPGRTGWCRRRSPTAPPPGRRGRAARARGRGRQAARVDLPARASASPDWVKVKLELTGDFVIGGWRPGARQIGGLLVGVPAAGRPAALPRPGRRRHRRRRRAGAARGARSRCARPSRRSSAGVPRDGCARARSGYAPRSSSRSSTASARRTAGCASRVSCGCVRIRHPTRWRSEATVPADRIRVEVEGRELELSNLDKVLYPAAGFTKGEVIDYYTRISPVLLPHLRDRPLTRIRYPNGVDGAVFFEKNAPAGTPRLGAAGDAARARSSKGRETIDYVVADDLPTLVWLANLAALELHTPQWRIGARPGPDGRRPGPGAAGRARRVLPGRGADARPARRRRHRRVPEDLRQEGHAAVLPDRRHPVRRGRLGLRQAGRRGAGARAPAADHRADGQAACGPARCSSTGARTTRPRPRSRRTRCAPSRRRPCRRR